MPSFLPPPNPNINYNANVFNYNPSVNMKHWRKALTNIRNNSGNARILCIGNSVALGIGSGTTNAALSSGEIKSGSFPTRLAQVLNTFGVNAHWNSFSGQGLHGAASWPGVLNSSDTRISAGNSWTPNINANILGGAYLKASTNTNAFSFTPTIPVDTFEIWVPRQTPGGFGTIQADVNGGAATTFNETSGGASLSVVKFNVTGTLGTNTVNVKWNAGATCYFVALSAYDSSKSWVDVMNAGNSGGTWGIVDNTLNIYPPSAGAQHLGMAPDLTIIGGSINDWKLGTGNLALCQAAMQTAITNALVAGDCIIMPDNPTITSSASTATQLAYINMMYGLAALNNIPLFDLWNRFNSYTTANNLGLIFNDNSATNFHPNNLGYFDEAQFVSQLLLEV